LLPIAIDLRTFDRADAVGDEIMRSIAEGQLLESGRIQHAELQPAIRMLLAARGELRGERQREAELRNNQLVNDQIRAMESSYLLKTHRAEELLQRLRSEGKDPRICALYEGRIRTLAARESERRRMLQSRLGVTVRIDPIAVALVSARRRDRSKTR
jgi:hypothetical protein